MVFSVEKYENDVKYFGKLFLIYGEVCSYIGKFKDSMGNVCISFYTINKSTDIEPFFYCNIPDGHIFDDKDFKHLRLICNLRIANPDINPDNIIKNVR